MVAPGASLMSTIALYLAAVRSLRAGVQPTLDPTPALRPYSGPVCLPRKSKVIGRCVRCVSATCREGGLSRSEHLVGYFYSVPLLDAPSRGGLLHGLALTGAVYYASQRPTKSV